MTITKELSVLVAEDDENSRFFFMKATSKCRFRGRLKVVDNGQKVLSALKRSPNDLPDLIILDVMMPQLSGLETLKQIRAHPQWCDIPVVMLTGNDDFQTKETCEQLNVNRFFKKPDNFSQLVDFVNSIYEIV